MSRGEQKKTAKGRYLNFPKGGNAQPLPTIKLLAGVKFVIRVDLVGGSGRDDDGRKNDTDCQARWEPEKSVASRRISLFQSFSSLLAAVTHGWLPREELREKCLSFLESDDLADSKAAESIDCRVGGKVRELNTSESSLS